MKRTLRLLDVLRWGSVIIALIFLISMFGQTPPSDVPLQTLEEATVGYLTESEVQPADSRMVRRLYGLNPTDFEDLILFYPSTNMGAEELLLVKLADTSQQEAVQAAVQTRLETQKTSFDGYGVEQFALLTEHSVIEVRGNYVLFIVCQDAQSARRAFLSAL